MSLSKQSFCLADAFLGDGGAVGEVLPLGVDLIVQIGFKKAGRDRQALVVLDAELRVSFANHAFYNRFQATPPETVGQRLYELGNRQWDIPELRRLLEEILPQEKLLRGYQVNLEFEHIGLRRMRLNARELEQADGQERMILLAIQDLGPPEDAA